MIAYKEIHLVGIGNIWKNLETKEEYETFREIREKYNYKCIIMVDGCVVGEGADNIEKLKLKNKFTI